MLSAVPVQPLQATGLLRGIPRPESTRYIRSRTIWVRGGVCIASATPLSAAVNQGTGERIADLFKFLPQHRVPQLTNPILREARASINTWGGDRPWSRGASRRGSSRPVGNRSGRGRTRGFKPPPLHRRAPPTLHYRSTHPQPQYLPPAENCHKPLPKQAPRGPRE